MAKFTIQPHGRLQEWIAHENGYFRAAGLDYEFRGGLSAQRKKEVDVGRFDAMREHERDHERRIGDLAEPELLQNLIGDPPHARRRHVAFDAGVDPRPGRADEL